ncbi:von Willebrand factor type A domain protein [Novipirellula galeiformis]|uniref:von Willebrand factor type A domain protein n=1 Tax=Novipirellula galeiformis TaxID=2528004 RepID=A0A5C6CJ43_9BACT|nr:VWA domain-containing protein [Novipirellula galeiformis]TWU24352.1 von Willebrand factor type A domain protein [Novipirellula galeiformis]
MMFPTRLGFDQPGYLWLLLLLPLLWWFGFSSLAALGRYRRAFALLFRSVVWTGIVLALAGVQLVWVSDRVTVMYLLDQSESIPRVKRQVMLDYVISNVRRHRDGGREDRAGIVVFGRDASIEIPPFDDDIPPLRRLESLGDRTDATNLEAALNLAQASMPEDTSRRIVIVTDGNENIGQARKLAARATEAGIGIDVVPVIIDAKSEVLVEKIDLPDNIRKGQPFEARIVISSYADAGASDPVQGKLRVKQKVGGQESLLLEQPVRLDPGKNVFPLRHQIEQPAGYTYEAEFVPNSVDDDGLRQNNTATAYTYVRGKGRVLLIEDKARLGDFDLMTDSLRDANIEVVKQSSDALFDSLAELQAYDAVILAGVPRAAGDSDEKLSSFTDEQIEMLVRNTQQLGAGLLMIGGPEAFGAGGWSGTEIEKAMPVDFKIRNSKIQAVGALACIMHASEMAEGNHWQKVIARAAVEQLGPADYAGVLHWTMNGDAWLWGGRNGLLEVGPNRKAMLTAIGRMTPGDMPQFDPAMRMAVAGLTRTPASTKHCIIISDGDPSDPLPATVNAFKTNNITISTVAVASHGLTESARLRKIAQDTGGKYYEARSGKALPRIFQREARRVSRPLVFEPPGGATPQVIFPHAVLDGVDRVLPNINGFVLTQTKDSPLAQVLIQSPKPDSPENATILAVWTYGLGRTAVLTTDAGARWAADWNEWGGYDKFYAQLVRWLMRPTGDTGKFSIATHVRDGEVQVVVNALNQDDSFLNFLEMNASALDPNLKPVPLRMRQTAPGRYVGSFAADETGSYFVNVVPGPGASPLTTGVTVPYSDEFRVRETNRALMQSLATLKPRGGDAGEVTVPLDDQVSETLVNTNAFRGGLALARSFRDAWPWFVLVSCGLFLGDVFVRRVAINFDWMGRAIARLRGQPGQRETTATARLDALQKSKDSLGDSLQRRKASVRFEATQSEGTAVDESTIRGLRTQEPRSEAKSNAAAPNEAEGPSYTERLLEAKRRAKREKGE